MTPSKWALILPMLSTGINIGLKEEANRALAETCNVGGALEQTMAMKRSNTYGVNMVTNYAATIEKNTGVKSTAIGAPEKFKAGIVDNNFQAAMTTSKMVRFGAKLMLMA